MSSPTPIHADISCAVGSTPLIRLDRLFPHAPVLAKLESVNPGGSSKDRPALAMVADALASGRLAEGGTVIESSSGNLGLALARVCAAHGVRFVCVVDSRANASTVASMRALGAEVDVVSEPDPLTGDLLTARRQRVAQLLEQEPGAINLHQYGNPANPGAHRDGTMAEIAAATDHRVAAILAACSTTGTIGGCAQYVAAHSMPTQVVAVDAVGSVLFGGQRGERKLPGMGAGVVTELSRQVQPDAVIRIDEIDSVAGARLLARREGILAGASTGAVIAAAIRFQQERPLEGEDPAVVMVHDGGAAYAHTIYSDDWVQRELGCPPQAMQERMAQLGEQAQGLRR